MLHVYNKICIFDADLMYGAQKRQYWHSHNKSNLFKLIII